MVLLGASFASTGVLIGGCGGSEQDAHEPKGSFALSVVHASFPAKQAISKPAKLMLTVRNTGTHTAPNVAVSLDSFSYTSHYPGLASSQRPVWIIDQGPGTSPKPPVETVSINPPGAATTAFVNTWAMGPLAPKHSRTFIWRVTPVKAGAHSVSFTVAAGLNGKAHAKLANGRPVSGHISVDVAPTPPTSHVDPNTGQVVPGPVLAAP